MHFLRDIPIQYLDNCPTIDQKYKVLFKLGTGRFSKVKMGLNIITSQRVAIKIMNHKIQQNYQHKRQQEKNIEIFLNQIKICLEAKHKYIVSIIDFNLQGIYKTSDGKVYKIMYYIMKIAQNGQLYRIINQTQSFNQKISRFIFKQLIIGIKHLHKKGYAHCDIKTQNILIDQKFNIKIADFGFSRQFMNQKQGNKHKINYNSSDTIGTIKCNAPELINYPNQSSYHADQIDIFALGCLLFQLVMKSPPFKTSDLKDQYYNKLAANQKHQFWEIFAVKCKPSLQFKDLIQKLLNPNPKDRITLDQIYKHSWFTGQTISKQQYRKQLSLRSKKVLLKVRKQQQTQIKKYFSKQRTKNQYQYQQQIINIQEYQINLIKNKQYTQKIQQIKQLLLINNQIATDSNSSQDIKQNKYKYKIKQHQINNNQNDKIINQSNHITIKKQSSNHQE